MNAALSSSCPSRRRVHGLTLIELVIVVAVIGVLFAVATPTWREHVASSRRSEAKAALMEIGQTMERLYSERSSYASARIGSRSAATDVLVYGQSTTRSGYYTLSFSLQTDQTYRLVATPAGAQAGDNCGSYTWDQAGTRGVSGGNPGWTVARCW